jgi:ATP-dependent Lon protease
VLDTIPAPLRDRMEVLELPGYTEEEKLAIARDHLVAKQVENHGLTKAQVTFSENGLRAIIRGYTREAGVRNLEREIGAVLRKLARRRAEGDEEKVKVTPELVHDLLGAPRYMDEEVKDRTRNPGVATGMAWTPVGGDVLFVEATRMAGNGSLTLTGQLGDVMKESARAALSWVRAHANEWQIDPEFFKNSELHVHVPSGAIPKDGPSAGVTMVTAMVSELTRRPVRADLSMTGEITLQGKVLPVGGIKEKVLAAKRLGIKEIILPKQNEKNVKEDLNEELRKGLTIHLVNTIDEVLLLALVHENDRARKTPARPPSSGRRSPQTPRGPAPRRG